MTPARRSPIGLLQLRWISYGGLGLFASALLVVTDGDYLPSALVTAVISLGFVAFGAWGLSITRAMGPLKAAAGGILAGRFADAERAIAAAERASTMLPVRRDTRLQRAIIALRRGELSVAEEHLDVVLALPVGVLGRLIGARQRATARSVRALVRAFQGRADEARVDLLRVRADADAPATALAYGAVAEAVLLEKSGDRAALRAHLAAHGDLLFEATAPRERALVRAYGRMLRVTAPGVYREAARVEEMAGGDEPALGAWVAKVAPGAVPYLRAGVAPAPSAPPVVEATTPALAPRRRPAGGVQVSVPLLVGAVVVGVLAWYGSLPGDRDPMGRWFDFLAAFMPAWFALYGAYFASQIMAARRDEQRLCVAGARALGGDLEGAVAAVEPLVDGRRLGAQASAHLLLAQIAERRGLLDDALAQCDLGLAALHTAALRAATSESTYPALLGQRAFVLAALGRDEDAGAELAALPATYLLAEAVRRRVELVRLVRRGAFDEARRVVDAASPDLGSSRRDELLMDLVRAAAGGAGAAEDQRLDEELRGYAEGRRWLEAVAPPALAAFTRLRAPDAPAPSTDDEAEVEALAALEAEEPARALPPGAEHLD
jgi:hypothetical protein